MRQDPAGAFMTGQPVGKPAQAGYRPEAARSPRPSARPARRAASQGTVTMPGARASSRDVPRAAIRPLPGPPLGPMSVR